MKFLDERIEIQIDMGTPKPSVGMYKYVLYAFDSNAQTEDDEIIFVGNFFYDAINRYNTFDVTDIIRSYKFRIDKYYFLNTTTYSSVYSGLANKFKLRVYLTESSAITSDWNWVAMIYRYPNVKKGLTDGGSLFNNASNPQSTNILYPLIQGYKENSAVPLISHFPLKDTVKYKFCQSFITSNDVDEFQLHIQELDEDYTIEVAREGNTTSCMIDLDSLFDWQYYEQELNSDVKIYKTLDGNSSKQIAVLDYCYKRYYLLWQDRYGGFQSQAFNDYATFNETFETTETQNYKNERSKAVIQVQPKWKLNSGWISEDLYPYYESIFVSPILVLYDAFEDERYEVIVQADYTEKTYKNEKKLLNISLDLEAASKQNIIY